jgi:FAD/FMN-containing dehydrogenase
MLEGLSPAYLQSHAGFSFLLDYVPNWKWAYGRERGQRGLIQYQPFVPHAVAHDVHTEILARCRRAGQVPYLGVFKRHRPDPFWLTHAVDGWSFALDFKVDPARRAELWKLCDELTELVISAEDTARFLPHDHLAAFARLKRECDPETLLEGKLYRRAFRDWICA